MGIQTCAIVSLALAGAVASAQPMPIPAEPAVRPTLTANPPVSQPPLDLKSAIKMAIEHNNTIQSARQKIEQARADTSTTRALIFPSLNLIGTSEERKGAVTGGGTAPFDGNPYNQYTAHLKLTQPLLAFGSLAAIRQSDYQIQINEIDAEMAERDLTVNVIAAFYKVLLNQRLLTILERTQSVVNESLATTQQRLRTGRGQLLDLLQAKTQIALLKPKIEDAHNQLESAGAQLASYLAEEGKYELQLRGTLRGLLLKDVQKHLNFKAARLPELERVRMQREQLIEQREVTGGKHLPNVMLLGDYGSSSFTKSDLFSGYNTNWSVMLQLTIPIFSGFQSIYERRSLGALDRQIEYQGLELENKLALAQVQSLKTLQSTGASLLSAEEAAELADQSMVEARRNYRLSTIDFLQFLTVQQSSLQAGSALETVRYDNVVALSKYFVATGQPLSVLVDLLQENKK